MELDLKKVFYVIVAIGMIGVMALCLVQPISKKIQEQKTQIEGVDFNAGVPAPEEP